MCGVQFGSRCYNIFDMMRKQIKCRESWGLFNLSMFG